MKQLLHCIIISGKKLKKFKDRKTQYIDCQIKEWMFYIISVSDSLRRSNNSWQQPNNRMRILLTPIFVAFSTVAVGQIDKKESSAQKGLKLILQF